MVRLNCVGCEHKRIAVYGSEETGVRTLACEQCGVQMTRRVLDGEYVYVPVAGRPVVPGAFSPRK